MRALDVAIESVQINRSMAAMERSSSSPRSSTSRINYKRNPQRTLSATKATHRLLITSLLLLLSAKPFLAYDAQPCTTSADCDVISTPTSTGGALKCMKGFCINPFTNGGCLRQRKDGWERKRICNSQDSSDVREKGFCRSPYDGLDYPEIRISTQNWDSGIFSSWVLQILLSEVLDVPATIESGIPEADTNFYDPRRLFQYGESNDWGALKRSSIHGDCRKVSQFNADNEYQPCGHVILEVWEGNLQFAKEWMDEGYTEQPLALGALGQQSWFIPKFTAQKDPTLLTYLGLQGDENRRKLAETFLRPTTWHQYCELVSANNCSVADDIAKRSPADGEERNRYFAQDLYTGHFRATDKNDCDKNPTNCTGHIADFPCGWASFAIPQTFHLNIALESEGPEPGSKGYSYEQLTEMLKAANATQSNLAIYWWKPEALFQSFLKTPSELFTVSLPSPSQDCVDNRIFSAARCSANDEDRSGHPDGACDESPHALQKILSTGIRKQIEAEDLPEARQSPAYEAIKRFQLTELEFGEYAAYTGNGMDIRDAACRWVEENLDMLAENLPKSYPRVLQEEQYNGPLFYLAIGLGVAATAFGLIAAFFTYQQRQRRVILYAQIEFLFILLAGIVMVGVGSIINASPPTDTSCVTVIWFLSHGYTLLLVPLIVKVAAINRLMHAARNFRRVVLNRRSLFGAVLIIDLGVMIYLIVWTVFDPPEKDTQYQLTNTETNSGVSIVSVNYYCDSYRSAFAFGMVAWNFLLIICASIFAFVTRNINTEFRETQTLAVMIYSHFIFSVLRLLTTLWEDYSFSESDLRLLRSIIYSCDIAGTVFIYFVPKFLSSDNVSSGMGSLTARMSVPTVGRRSSMDAHASATSLGNQSSNSHLDLADIHPPNRCSLCGTIKPGIKRRASFHGRGSVQELDGVAEGHESHESLAASFVMGEGIRAPLMPSDVSDNRSATGQSSEERVARYSSEDSNLVMGEHSEEAKEADTSDQI